MEYSECWEIVEIKKIWLKIKKFPPWRSYFFYFDTDEYLADSVFAEHGLKVRFTREEWVKPGFHYRGILCSVKRKDEWKFIDAIDSVKKKMLLCGHTDYEQECLKFLNEMEACREVKDEVHT